MKLLAVLVLASLSLMAKTNFQGDYKLNTSKSDFGPFPPPVSWTQKVAHEDPSLKIATKVSTDNGDFEFNSAYTTDGKECTNQFGPGTFKSTLKWEGDVLIITSKGSFGDNEMTMEDKWELSSDGKTLTISRKWTSAQGEALQKMILEKQ